MKDRQSCVKEPDHADHISAKNTNSIVASTHRITHRIGNESRFTQADVGLLYCRCQITAKTSGLQ